MKPGRSCSACACEPRRRGVVALLGGAVLLAAPASARAQDIDAVARLRGVSLPAAYYDQVRADPDAYAFTRALFRRAGPSRVGVAGSVRLPVVLALFSDSPPPHISRDMVQASVFDGPAARGTLTEAYLEMSNGALHVGGDVFPWVRTSYTLAEVVGESDGLAADGAVGPHFREALDSLDALVDFRAYDNDGPDGVADSGDDDGFVDVIVFEYLEVEASCGGPGIWPHRWTLSSRLGAPYVSDDIGVGGDSIRVDDYTTQGVSDCAGAGVQDASTMAHELGHALGLPDYYHWIDRSDGARGRRWVLGCWELMAAGSWGCGPVDEPRGVFGPTHLSARSKHRLGWIDYLEVGEVWNEEIFLDPVQTSALALRVPVDGTGVEFLIAEYRAQAGFDAQLPADGVLFYKQDSSASLLPDPNGTSPYFLTLLERDDNRGLLRTDREGGNRGEAGDAWGVGGSLGELHALTSPPLRTSAGAATSVTVHEVSVVGGRARIVVSTSPAPRLLAPAGPLEPLASLRIAGGVMPYTAIWYGTGGVSLDVVWDDIAITSPTVSPGPAELVVSVRDAAGARSAPFYASASGRTTWAVQLAELLGPFFLRDDDMLSPVQRGYLDRVGNNNGVYDVGDLRRWLRENPAP